MKNWLLKILVCSVNVFILAYILPGIKVEDMWSAIMVAVVLSVLDFFIKPLLVLFTLPATIFTLGLFLFVINACVIMLDDYFVHGFSVVSFWHAMLFSVLLSFFNGLVNGKIKASVHIDKNKKD
ncbi:MAG: phage holin family protein [Chitinophagaceae bacterium]|nr:phage holin family protein [Chitinophagaceae bacterium]